MLAPVQEQMVPLNPAIPEVGSVAYNSAVNEATRDWVVDDLAPQWVKLSEKFGRKVMQMVWRQYNHSFARYSGNREGFRQLIKVALGEDPDRITVGSDPKNPVTNAYTGTIAGNKTLQELRETSQVKRLHLMGGVLNTLIGMAMETRYEATVECVDAEAKRERTQLKTKMKALRQMKQQGMDISPNLAELGIEEVDFPMDDESLAHYLESNPSYDDASELHERLTAISNETRYQDMVRRDGLWYEFVTGIRMEYDNILPDGRISVEPVNIADCVLNYDFANPSVGLTYVARPIAMSLSQIQRQMGRPLTKEEVKILTGVKGLRYAQDGGTYRADMIEMGANMAIHVYHIRIKFEEPVDIGGQTIYKDEVYEGWYIPAKDFMLKWGLANVPAQPVLVGTLDMPFNLPLKKSLGYRVYVAGGVEGNVISAVEMSMEYIKILFGLFRNLKVATNNYVPKGLAINIDRIREITIGEDNLSLEEVVELYKLLGDYYYSNVPADGGPARPGDTSKPFDELNNGLDPSIANIIGSIRGTMDLWFQQLGIPQVLQGRMQNSEQGKGVSEMMMQGANASMRHYMLADKMAYEDFARTVCYSAWQSMLVEGAAPENRAYDIRVNALPTQTEWQQYFGMLTDATAKGGQAAPGGISPYDALTVMERQSKGLPAARRALKSAMMRYERKQEEIAKRNQDYNMQGQAQSNQQANEAKMMVEQMKAQQLEMKEMFATQRAAIQKDIALINVVGQREVALIKAEKESEWPKDAALDFLEDSFESTDMEQAEEEEPMENEGEGMEAPEQEMQQPTEEEPNDALSQVLADNEGAEMVENQEEVPQESASSMLDRQLRAFE